MHFLAAILVPLLALFFPTTQTAPTQAFPKTARSAPQYYCLFFYQQTHYFQTSYIIQGRNSIIKEPLLRAAVESTPLCAIKEWHYVDGENKDGMNDFDLLFDFGLGFNCQARLRKKLGELIGEKIECPVKSWKDIEAHHVGLHGDLRAYSDLDNPV